MKKHLLFSIFIIFLLSTSYSFSQTPSWAWAKSAGGTDYDYGSSVTTDTSGNIYVAGFFRSSSITFGLFILNNADNTGGSEDMFLVKYDANGNVLWAKSAGGGTSGDLAWSVTTDASGNVYVAGYFGSSTITFGSTVLTNAGSSNIFIVKYDVSGNVLWAKSAGGSVDAYAQSVATDASGNVYVAGYFGSSTITFGSTTLNNTGSYDMFLAKYDTSGNALWAKSAGGTTQDYGRSVSTDANGNAFVTGDFWSDSITFGSTILTNAGSDDIFIVKYGANGNILWAKSAGGTPQDAAYSVAVDASGNSYVAGYFRSDSITFGSTILTNAGSDDIFIVKYASNGNVLWAKSAGGTYGDVANSVTADANGNIFVVGYFSDSTITFGSTTLTNMGGPGYPDVFLVKYDASGNVFWAKSAGGSTIDRALAVNADATGNVFVSGFFGSYSVSFDFSTIYCNWGYDIFLAKISKCGSPQVIDICLVSVDTATSTKNYIVWEKPSGVPIDSFRIYRQISSQYVRIASVPYSSLSQFIDTTNGINPKLTSYKYKISIVDTCGDEGPLSSYHQTMHFLVSPANPIGYNLFWNDYQGFPFNQYYIWRDGNNTNNWQILDSVSVGITTYTDPTPPTDSARYWIEAVKPNGCNVTIKNPTPQATTIKSTKSNTSDKIISGNGIQEYENELKMSIYPNPSSGKFTIQSFNFDIQSLEIYTIYGEKVFQTTVNKKQETINLSEANGIYFLKVVSEKEIVMKKIMIAR